jgi:hypothetical protein
MILGVGRQAIGRMVFVHQAASKLHTMGKRRQSPPVMPTTRGRGFDGGSEKNRQRERQLQRVVCRRINSIGGVAHQSVIRRRFACAAVPAAVPDA